MFPRDFRRPKRAKVKKHLKTRGKRWANWEHLGLRSSALLGLVWELVGASLGLPLRVVHYPTKLADSLSLVQSLPLVPSINPF